MKSKVAKIQCCTPFPTLTLENGAILRARRYRDKVWIEGIQQSIVVGTSIEITVSPPEPASAPEVQASPSDQPTPP